MSSKGTVRRRTFSEECKRHAFTLVIVEGNSRAAAARAVGVSCGTFRTWYDNDAPQPEPCGPLATVERLQAEAKRLHSQLRQAKLEREESTQATAFFAKQVAMRYAWIQEPPTVQMRHEPDRGSALRK